MIFILFTGADQGLSLTLMWLSALRVPWRGMALWGGGINKVLNEMHRPMVSDIVCLASFSIAGTCARTHGSKANLSQHGFQVT